MYERWVPVVEGTVTSYEEGYQRAVHDFWVLWLRLCLAAVLCFLIGFFAAFAQSWLFL